MNNPQDYKSETLAETENFLVWRADEPDGETVYYLQLGRATLNFFAEEWDELLAAIPQLSRIEAERRRHVRRLIRQCQYLDGQGRLGGFLHLLEDLGR